MGFSDDPGLRSRRDIRQANAGGGPGRDSSGFRDFKGLEGEGLGFRDLLGV